MVTGFPEQRPGRDPNLSAVSSNGEGPTHAMSGRWKYGMAVFAITFAVFSTGLDHEFLNWDDGGLVAGATEIRSLNADSVYRIISTFLNSNYTPLERLSYALDYRVWGMDPFGFCLTNILLHSLNSALVFILALQLLAQAFPDRGAATADHGAVRCWSAACAALAFGIHPLRVESVTWIAERRDVLSLFWLLVTVLLHLRAIAAPEGFSRRSWLRMGSWLAFVCSVLSKAAGVTLPVVLLLMDFYPLRRCSLGSPDRWWLVRCVVEKIPWFLLALVAGLVAVWGQSSRGAMIHPEVYPWAARGLNACVAIVFYAHHWLVPWPLYPVYPTAPRQVSLFEDPVFLSVGLVCLLGWGSLRIARSRPGVCVVWWSYFVMILPFTGLLQAGNPFAADRYTYLATIPFCLLVGGMLYEFFVAHGLRMARAALAWTLLALAGWSVLTLRQIPVWQNSLVFWPHVLGGAPNEFNPLNNYSTALMGAHQPYLACVMARETTRAKPRWDVGWHNLGVALSVTGRGEAAVSALRRALGLNPSAADTHLALAKVLFRQGDAMGARQHAFASLRNQVTTDGFITLALVLHGSGEPGLARKYLAAAILAGDSDGWLVWAEILAGEGRLEEAQSLLNTGYQKTRDPRFLELKSRLAGPRGVEKR